MAPATANVIGKFANGIADDFLSSLYLATKAPVLMAPAMNTHMLEHEAVRRNLDLLAARGVRFVDPGAGYLACGWIGKGRLAEPAEIVAAAEQVLGADRPAEGDARAGDGRSDARGARPGAFRRQSLERQDGLRARRGRARPGRGRRADLRPHRARSRPPAWKWCTSRPRPRCARR